MDKTLSRLSNYAAGFRADMISPAVIHQAKRLSLDTLACAIGAQSSVPVKIGRALAERSPSESGATIIGTRHKTAPDLAAFVNGTMARYLDFNDTYIAKATCHPSDNFPVVLAAGEASGATGLDILSAFVLAYEMLGGLTETYRMRDGGPWDQATNASISTAMGVAKVMGLDAGQIANAVALSVVQGIHLGEARRGKITHIKSSTVANAGKNAIFAAQLAELGFTGPPDAFEGSEGFFVALGHPGLDLLPLAREGDGEQAFRIMNAHLKRYPVGFFAQSAVEAAVQCRNELGIESTSGIDAITVKTFDNAIEFMAPDRSRWRPATRESADHSLPFAVAMAMEHGVIIPDHYDDAVLQNPQVHDLLDKIDVVAEAECQNAYPDACLSIVTVKTKSGRSHMASVPHHLGHASRPMSDGDIEAKFRGMAEGLLSHERQTAAIDATWRLDEIKDISAYLRLFAD